MGQKYIVFMLLVGCAFFSFSVFEADANIIIKVRALNPLENEEVAAIRYPLPPEITPSDIITKNIIFSLPQEETEEPRKSDFNVEYIEDEGRYFIVDEVVMGPREVVTLEAHVRDIWVIGEDRFSGIRKNVEDLIAQVAKEPPEGEEAPGPEADGPDETVTMLQEEISSQLDEIAGRQAKNAVILVGVEKHMEAYYENMESLTQVEADVAMLRNLLEPEEEKAEEVKGAGEEGALEPERDLSE